MKKTYSPPELELLCLASEERLADNGSIDFDVVLGGSGSQNGTTGTISEEGDVIVPIPGKK